MIEQSTMSEVTAAASLFVLVGLLFVGLSIPLVQNRVPPNRYYGFRTPKTLSNTRIWYEANQTAGSDLFVAGALIAVSSLVLLIFAQAWKPQHVAITLVSVMVLSLSGAAWHGYMILRRM